MKRSALPSLLLSSCFVAACAVDSPEPAGEQSDLAAQHDALEERLYVAAVQVWTDNGNVVPVCWATSGWSSEKSVMQTAILNTWVKESGLKVTFTSACPTSGSTRYLKMAISPQAKLPDGTYPNLGGDGSSYLGMATFRLPSESALTNFALRPDHLADTGRLQYLAVHEFGHALGFHHEQDRPENEGGVNCNSGVWTDKTGAQLGNYDQNSIMNYCNADGNRLGNLTETDRQAVRRLYGTPAGVSEKAFLAADTNFDGRGDLVQAYRGWASLPQCKYNGSSFACTNDAATIYDSGSNEQRFLSGDFNGDGRDDVMQTYRGWASIPTCRATAAGGWTCNNYAATIYDSGSSEQRFLTGDFDGDHRTDVVQTSRKWASIPLCKSTGSGWSCANPSATIYDSGSWEQEFLTGDFNNDGRDDVVQTYRKWASIPLCKSTGSGWTCSNPAATIYDSGSAEQRFRVGDFNGDGRDDVIQTYRKWSSIPLCTSTGSAWTCSNPSAVIFDSGSQEQEFLVGDFNGDGRQDVAQTYRGWSSIPVCFADGAGWTCHNLPATIFNSGSAEQRFVAKDVNGDGKTDIVQTYRGWSSYPVCFSTGSGWSCSNLAATIY